MNLEQLINEQKNKIELGNPKIELLRSCRVGDGIDTTTDTEKQTLIQHFDRSKENLKCAFFIPSSGSGSRMFGTLYDFLQQDNPNEETIEFVEHLINRIEDFALYNKLPESIKDELRSGNIDIEKFIQLLLAGEGFDYGNRPKGLIPFHRYGNFIINPFQEHILQGTRIGGEKTRFHFTINAAFEKQIKHSIKILREITGINFYFEFSEQDSNTNSIAFTTEGSPFYDEHKELVTRPAGHGALIHNLNTIDADLIFIRNIDNIQHQDHSKKSIESRKWLAAKLLKFQEEVHALLHQLEKGLTVTQTAQQISNAYKLNISAEILNDTNKLKAFFDRPIRICGMVKNEGQPGGGPFWVKNKNGIANRQIIEKSQISSKSSQIGLLIKSTHFNPVEIICAPKNYTGQKFDLTNFKDDSQYFIVNKTHKGIPVNFIELPGLWNGGMSDWISIFYEIENTCFSPVKTVLDLLKPLHREKA